MPKNFHLKNKATPAWVYASRNDSMLWEFFETFPECRIESKSKVPLDHFKWTKEARARLKLIEKKIGPSFSTSLNEIAFAYLAHRGIYCDL